MKRQRIHTLLESGPGDEHIDVYGWVRTKRDTKQVCFLEINDGSSFAGLQVIFDKSTFTATAALEEIQTGASVRVGGHLVESPAKGQSVELAADEVELIGAAPAETYPLQKKRHSFEFLREIAHLRPRTNTFGAVTRVRNAMSMAVHHFFQEHGFYWVHTPIITGSDAEGAGEMFQVTTLSPDTLPAGLQATDIDYGHDFFGKKTFLTVSGQLNAEIYACGLDRVYTFGPTFRAENSNTSRHLAEFWMIEPEMAFCDIGCNMDLAEEFLKYIFHYVLTTVPEDMEFFHKRIQPGIIDSLQQVVTSNFERISYTEAVKRLEQAGQDFEFPVQWGMDLQSEHEKYLTETVYKKPVIVTDYPKDIKAFYMTLNDDEKTVRAMDVLVPRLGEIIGGSQREHRLEVLQRRIAECGLQEETYWWYLDLRRFGTVPHAGFGLGFERCIQYVTGMANIRDVIPFPRTVHSAEF